MNAFQICMLIATIPISIVCLCMIAFGLIAAYALWTNK